MGFFLSAAKELTQYLSSRNENQALKEALDRARNRDWAMIEYVWEEIFRLDYHGLPHYTASGPVLRFQYGDATLRLGEEWLYPSADLLRWRDRVYPYDREAPRAIREPSNGATPDNPWNWQGRLRVVISARGQDFFVILHYNTLPWNRPREMAKFLGNYAAHLGLGRRQVEQALLQDLRNLDPALGRRVWHMFVDADIRAEPLHTQLAIFAWRQGFPVPQEDGDRAMKFVERLVRHRAIHSSEEDIEQFQFECKQHLLQSFDLPSSPDALSAYISSMVKGMLVNKARARFEQSPMSRDDPPYTIPEALMRLRVDIASQGLTWALDRRRLYDWIAAKKVEALKLERGNILITEKGLEQALALTKAHHIRQSLRELVNQRGLSWDRAKKMIQRHRMPDGTPDWETIYRKITTASPKRRRTRHKKPLA